MPGRPVSLRRNTLVAGADLKWLLRINRPIRVATIRRSDFCGSMLNKPPYTNVAGDHMVVVTGLGLALGIGLAQFFRAFALVPTIMVAGAGTALIEAAGGHTVVYALLASLCVAFALQLGFLSGVFFNGFVVRSRRSSAGLPISRLHEARELQRL
jgi:hypothetical protein